jgi:hypothetical protein
MDQQQSFKPYLNKNDKPKKTKAYKYATSSLIGALAYAILLSGFLWGYIIAGVTLVYAVLSIRLALKDKDQSTATKGFVAILIVVIPALLRLANS